MNCTVWFSSVSSRIAGFRANKDYIHNFLSSIWKLSHRSFGHISKPDRIGGMSVSSITSRTLNNKEFSISSVGASALRPSCAHRHILHDNIASRALSCSWSSWDEGHHRFTSFSTHASRGSRVPHGPSSDTESQPLPSGSANESSLSSGGYPPTNDGASAPAKYSPLHMNIEEFCCKIIPTEDEKKVKQDVVEG